MSRSREIVKRINFITSIKQITQAMKMVSASKLSKITNKVNNLNSYLLEFSRIMKMFSDLEYVKINPSTNGNEAKQLIIVLTSDKGMCGAFNSKILKFASTYIDTLPNDSFDILTIGRKGLDFFKKSRAEVIIDKYVNLCERLSLYSISDFVDFLMGYLHNPGGYSSVNIIYNNLGIHNGGEVSNVNLFPSMIPNFNNNVDYRYICEPDKKIIYDELLKPYITISIYNFLLQSSVSENKFRMIAMSKANENADELLKDLKLAYNKSRQSLITREISEIVAGFDSIKY